MNRNRLYRLILSVLLLSTVACHSDNTIQPISVPSLMEIPKGFPEIEAPEGNEFTLSRWQLGKKLFYDPILSVDSSISCASCHQQSLGFSDNIDFSRGVNGALGTRNSPTLTNIAYHPYFTREGGVPTLEMQVLVPIQEHNEFNFNMVLLAERLNTDSTYVQMAQRAYNRTPDPFVITRALACFERSLISGNSPYDQYTQHHKLDAMSTNQINGMQLFFSERTNCSQCHNGFNFTNYAFENNGLYEVYADEGRYRLTLDEADKARFKVPSLRNIELTAPYMHDGQWQTLEEIIQHYVNGGQQHPQKSEWIRPLDLTADEQQDLIAFLKALTDDSFINNPNFEE